MKLAVEWKGKMVLAIENSWEVLGFLRLIAAYGCTGICDAGELQSLLAMVEQPEQASELSRALGITDEVPDATVTFLLLFQILHVFNLYTIRIFNLTFGKQAMPCSSLVLLI